MEQAFAIVRIVLLGSTATILPVSPLTRQSALAYTAVTFDDSATFVREKIVDPVAKLETSNSPHRSLVRVCSKPITLKGFTGYLLEIHPFLTRPNSNHRFNINVQ